MNLDDFSRLESRVEDMEAGLKDMQDGLAKLKRDLQKEKPMSELDALRRFRKLAGNRMSNASNPMAVQEEEEYWKLMDLTYHYVSGGN